MRQPRWTIRPALAAAAGLLLAAVPIQAGSIDAAGLTMRLPDSWHEETPSSSMRAAQARVPGSAGDGQFAVFHFGEGGGGGVEANIARWVGQMDLAGREPERTEFDVGDLRVHWVDASGTLKASRIGSFPPTDQPGYRLFGAVVEGAGGPWYLRLVGPEATLAEHHDAFRRMLAMVNTTP